MMHMEHGLFTLIVCERADYDRECRQGCLLLLGVFDGTPMLRETTSLAITPFVLRDRVPAEVPTITVPIK